MVLIDFLGYFSQRLRGFLEQTAGKRSHRFDMNLRLLFILLALQGGLLGKAAAQDIYITGQAGYEVLGPNYLRLYATEITNFRPLGSISGTLAFQLWATYTPYSGGTLTGYYLAHGALGELEGDHFASNVYVDTGIALPPRGYYYLSFVLAEFNGAGFVVQDYANFSGPQYLDGPVYSNHLPAVRIDSPRRGKTISKPRVTVTGTTTDDIAVTLVKVYLNNKLVRSFYPYSSRWRVVARNVRLGKNTIKVVAFDQGGLSTTRTVKFTRE